MVLRCLVALSISAQAQAPAPRLAVNPIEGATVLVGAVSASSGTTFGTGFIVEHRGRAYVVTCRHVILEAPSTDLFAIPRPQKTKSPAAVLKVGKPAYHPKDGIAGTYDVAVLQIVGATRERLRALGVVPFRLRSPGVEQLNEGLALGAAGYPVDYAEPQLLLGKPEALRPLGLVGIVRHLPIEGLEQNGFGATLREGYFAQATERTLGKGASGGPVYVEDGAHAVRVVGVLLGSAEVQISEHGRSTGVFGFVFASSLRVIETLETLR